MNRDIRLIQIVLPLGKPRPVAFARRPAGGWRSDAGKGSAVTWTSLDGVTWQPPTWEPSFSGGQITGVAISGASVVAVGRTGYPDWNTAAIWMTQTP